MAQRAGRRYLEFASLVRWATVEIVRSFALVLEPSTQAIELARQHGWTDDPLAGEAYLALGAALVWRGRLEEAEPWIQRPERAVREEAEPAAGLRATLAALRLAQGDPRAAALALGPVIDGSAPVTHRASLSEALLLEATVRDALGDSGAAAAPWSARWTSPSPTARSCRSCCIPFPGCSSTIRGIARRTLR